MKTISNKADFLYPKHTNIPIRWKSAFEEFTAQNIAHIAFSFNGECDTYLWVCIWVYEHLIFSNVSTRDPFLFVCFLRFRFFFLFFFYSFHLTWSWSWSIFLSHFHSISYTPNSEVSFILHILLFAVCVIDCCCYLWTVNIWLVDTIQPVDRYMLTVEITSVHYKMKEEQIIAALAIHTQHVKENMKKKKKKKSRREKGKPKRKYEGNHIW